MLISHKYKFIFIKTKKTAGTSIEIELSKIMADNDTVTPIKPPHQNHNPRNFVIDGNRFYPHTRAKDLKKKISSEIFNEYYKFCVEREPVDKCISHFSMLKNSPYHNKQTINITWQDYIRAKNFPIDYESYTDKDNELCVDKIIKFEKLEEGILSISKKCGFSFRGLNERAKSGFRENIDIKNKEKEVIYKAFNESNKYTGYYLK